MNISVKIFLLVLVMIMTIYPQSEVINISDTERLIRLEEGQKSLEKRFDDMNKRLDDMNKRFDDVNKRFEDVNKRFDDVNRQIDSPQNIMLAIFAVTFAGIFAMISFVLWDRRTTLAPVLRDTKEIKEIIETLRRDDKALKLVLQEFAKENETLNKIMNKASML